MSNEYFLVSAYPHTSHPDFDINKPNPSFDKRVVKSGQCVKDSSDYVDGFSCATTPNANTTSWKIGEVDKDSFKLSVCEDDNCNNCNTTSSLLRNIPQNITNNVSIL